MSKSTSNIGHTRLNWTCNCVDAARQQNFASFKKVHHSKAVIHTYLTWQDEPSKPLL